MNLFCENRRYNFKVCDVTGISKTQIVDLRFISFFSLELLVQIKSSSKATIIALLFQYNIIVVFAIFLLTPLLTFL